MRKNMKFEIAPQIKKKKMKSKFSVKKVRKNYHFFAFVQSTTIELGGYIHLRKSVKICMEDKKKSTSNQDRQNTRKDASKWCVLSCVIFSKLA